MQKWIEKIVVIVAVGVALSASISASATTIQVQTTLGDFEINLYDNKTPATVTNFLGYVNEGDYNDTYYHRLIRGFILQGGGFKVNEAEQFETMPPVINEPKFSNVRGTIAMAKIGDDPNSATSQWFINLVDNSANLDRQNSGFTVFGEVVSGIEVVDAIAELPTFNDAPVTNFTQEDADNGTTPSIRDNYIIINQVVVLDASPDTADNITPTPALQAVSASKKKSGSFTPNWLILVIAGFFCLMHTNSPR